MAQISVISSSGLVKPAGGTFYGYVCQSSSSGTIKAWDGLTAAGRVLLDTSGTITAPVSVPIDRGVQFQTGLFITIGGTASVGVIWE